MFVRIEPGSGVPISRQIADQVRAQCASGVLAPGDRLPSIRELARELAVNQNTILRVYERLTGEGLLERRHGDGTYVSKLLRAAADRLVLRARLLGMGPEELRQLLDNAAARAERHTPTRKGKANE